VTIDCVTIATAHRFGDAIASQHRLRHRVFIERQGWNVMSWEGMEFDQFDTLATTYFLWSDDHGAVRGTARIYPTMLPYMLQSIWPDMVTEEPLPRDPHVWEGSRIAIDASLDRATQKRVLGELFCAYLEFGLSRDIDRFLVLMPLAFLRRTVARAGWPPRLLGPTRKIGRHVVVAASMKVSRAILGNVREHMGIARPVLRPADRPMRDKAA
jgi:N-acyl-L-homoserine lactone synthetase